MADTPAPAAPRAPADRSARVEVALDLSNRAALEALADALGEIAADLWLAGRLDVG